MRARRTFLMILCLLTATGFGLGPATTGREAHLVELSSYQAYSLNDLMPALEAALGTIARAERVNDVLAVGPNPPSNDQPVPAIPVEPAPREDRAPVEAAPADPPAEVAAEPPADAPTEQAVIPVPIPRPKPRPPVEAAPDSACDGCTEHVRMSDLRYMQCSSRNNYLEDELTGLKNGGSLMGDLIKRGPRQNAAIKASCVKAGLETLFGENSTSFIQCGPGKNTPTTGKRRACISENYFTITHNSIDLVSRCMAPYLSSDRTNQRNDLRLMLGVMAQESGLHFNAGNGSGASGLGQLTQDSIDAVNRLELANIRSHLSKQGGDCARLGTELLRGTPPMRGGVSYRCDRMSLSKGNPALNLIYTFGNIKLSKRQLQSSIFNDRRYSAVFSGLSAADRNKLETAIVIWSHNTGVGGMQVPLTSLLNSKYRGKKITNVETFLSELKQAHRDYPHAVYRGKPAAIREKSGYYTAVSTRLGNLERNAGGGSCVAL